MMWCGVCVYVERDRGRGRKRHTHTYFHLLWSSMLQVGIRVHNQILADGNMCNQAAVYLPATSSFSTVGTVSHPCGSFVQNMLTHSLGPSKSLCTRTPRSSSVPISPFCNRVLLFDMICHVILSLTWYSPSLFLFTNSCLYVKIISIILFLAYLT